jgi:hypothetical protein
MKEWPDSIPELPWPPFPPLRAPWNHRKHRYKGLKAYPAIGFVWRGKRVDWGCENGLEVVRSRTKPGGSIR